MKQLAWRYGSWMFLCFTAFFLLMHLFGLSEHYYLRAFNGLIQVTGLWLVLQAWQREHPGHQDDYANGVVMGFLTTMVSVIPFTLFMVLFLAYNPAFMLHIRQQSPIGSYFNPVTASLFILIEGFAMGLIGSFVIMRIQEAMRLKT
jgi:hypothetical protein